MAKKKEMMITAMPYDYKNRSDNNPDGPSNLPNNDLDGCQYKSGKMFIPGFLDKGESPNTGDINLITANGVQSSKGQGKNSQFNWNKGTDGAWNNNEDWAGGNLTGM